MNKEGKGNDNVERFSCYDIFRRSLSFSPYLRPSVDVMVKNSRKNSHFVLHRSMTVKFSWRPFSEKLDFIKKVLKKEKVTDQDELLTVLTRPDDAGNTPLHIAAFNDDHECCAFFIKWGAKVNVTNHAQQTPLFLAVAGQAYNTVKLLLSRGADPSLKAFMDPSNDRNAMWNCFHFILFSKSFHKPDILLLRLLYRYCPSIIATSLVVHRSEETDLEWTMYPCGIQMDHEDVSDELAQMHRRYCHTSEMEHASCNYCKVARPDLWRCSYCMSTFYCSTECQSADRKHLTSCRKVKHNHELVFGHTDSLLAEDIDEDIDCDLHRAYGFEPFPLVYVENHLHFFIYGKVRLTSIPKRVQTLLDSWPGGLERAPCLAMPLWGRLSEVNYGLLRLDLFARNLHLNFVSRNDMEEALKDETLDEKFKRRVEVHALNKAIKCKSENKITRLKASYRRHKFF